MQQRATNQISALSNVFARLDHVVGFCEKEFIEIKKKQEEIKSYVEQKNRKSASLNEVEYLTRREKLNAEKEDEKTIEDQVNHSNLEIKRDYYLDEVLQITVDYLKMLPGKKVVNN